MQRKLAVIMTSMLLLSLCGCSAVAFGNGGATNSSENSSTSSSQIAIAPPQEMPTETEKAAMDIAFNFET